MPTFKLSQIDIFFSFEISIVCSIVGHLIDIVVWIHIQCVFTRMKAYGSAYSGHVDLNRRRSEKNLATAKCSAYLSASSP